MKCKGGWQARRVKTGGCSTQRAQQAEELRAATWQDRRNALPSLALGAACPAPAATSTFQPHWPGLGSRHHTHHSPGPTQCCPDSTPLKNRTSGWAVCSPVATPSPVGSLGSQDQQWSLPAFPSSRAHFIPRSGRCGPPALKQLVTLGQQQLVPLSLEGKHPVAPRWTRHPSLGWVKNDQEHGAQV